MPTMLEALQSGQCFKTPAGNIWKLFNKKPCLWSLNGDGWKEGVFSFHSNCDVEYVDDPSILPKPTLESLPAWTRCKVKPVNYTVGICDVIKKPGGSFEYYDSGNGFGFVNVNLISIYNPKTEQWEDV